MRISSNFQLPVQFQDNGTDCQKTQLARNEREAIARPPNALWPEQACQQPLAHGGFVPVSLRCPAVDMENTEVNDKTVAMDGFSEQEDRCIAAFGIGGAMLGGFLGGSVVGASTAGLGAGVAGALMGLEGEAKGALLGQIVCPELEYSVTAEKTTGPKDASPVDFDFGMDGSQVDEDEGDFGADDAGSQIDGEEVDPTGPSSEGDLGEPTGTEGTADPTDESVPTQGDTGTDVDPTDTGDDSSDDDGTPNPDDPVGKPDPNDPTGFQAFTSLAAYTKNEAKAPAFLTGNQLSIR